MSVEKLVGKTIPSKFELLANKLIQNGERVRVEYSGKQLQSIPEMAQFIEELGLKKPSVMVGVNGHGNSAVAGVVVKDGKDVVLKAAGGVDYTFGEKPLIQLRGRVAEGQGARLNIIADLNKPVNAENMAVSMANKGGNLDVTVDSDMISGNLKADMNSKEMRTPAVKRFYDEMMEAVTGAINGNKGVKKGVDRISESLNKIKEPFKGERCAKAVVEEIEVPTPKTKEISDDLRKVAADLRRQGDEALYKMKEAQDRQWKKNLSDEDCEFLAERAKKLGIRFDDPEILLDPEIIKRFSLNP